MAPPAYTTLDKLKTAIGITTADHDAELTDVIEQVSSLFDLLYGQTFQSETVKEWHDGSHSQDGIILDQIPSEADAAIVIVEGDTALVLDTDYRLDPYPSRRIGRLDASDTPRLGGFTSGTKNVFVTYADRFTVIPSDIERATLDESIRAWQAYNSSGASDGARIGISQRSPETGTNLTYTTDDLSPTTLRLVETYRRQRAF